MMEVDYTAQLIPGLIVTPKVQFVVNPDGLGGLPYPKHNINNSVVIGLKFQVDVTDLVGLEIKPAARQKTRRFDAGFFVGVFVGSKRCSLLTKRSKNSF